MNTPWLKSLIFWVVMIAIIFAIFQCTQKTENNKIASTLMYERLYQCTRDLTKQNQPTLNQIQKNMRNELTQKEIMKLINLCRKTNPTLSKENYIQRIKSHNL